MTEEKKDISFEKFRSHCIKLFLTDIREGTEEYMRSYLESHEAEEYIQSGYDGLMNALARRENGDADEKRISGHLSFEQLCLSYVNKVVFWMNMSC